MPRDVKIPEKARLANVAESRIRSLLESFSTVNKFQEDIGIDFYCELIEQDHPSTTFYVQAKGTEYFGDVWSASIKKTTIRHWLLQMFPVFLILYDEDTGNCYWMSIENRRYNLINKISQKTGETIRIKMDKLHVLKKGIEGNVEFVREIKDGLRSIWLFRGYPRSRGEGYVKTIPPPPRTRSELSLIKDNIKQSMYSLIHHYLLLNDLENACLCCEFLTKFDKSHYNHFAWFGEINRVLGNKELAKKSFEEALRICKRDKNWPRESMKRIIAFIDRQIESCK